MKPHLFILPTFIASAIGPAIALAQSPADRDSAAAVAAIERTLVAAIAAAEPSVVAISRSTASNSADDPEDAALNLFRDLRPNDAAQPTTTITGAGVIIDPAGLVLTHYLAVREGDQHAVTTIDGKTHSATIRAADPRSALAVLAIEPWNATQPQGNSQHTPQRASFQIMRLGDAQTLRKGQFVVAIGNPFAIQSDGQPTASWGIVTNLARKAPANTNLNDAPGPNGDYRTTLHHLGTLIQTDAKLGWSAAGAALINMQGELVGITTTAATIAGHEQPAGYAIPINATFRHIIDTLKEGREVEYGMLGITFDNFASGRNHPGSTELAEAGRRAVTVGDVFPGTPAARAGLKTGDIIRQVDGRAVDEIDSMQLVVSTLPPSTSTTIDYERGGRTATTKATVAKLAVNGKIIATARPDAWRGIRVDYATALDGQVLMEAIASGAYDAQGCVLVSEVEPESEAWQAGIRAGMFISHVGKKRVSTPDEFRAATPAVDNEFNIRLTRPVEELSADSDPAGADSRSGRSDD